MRKTAPSFLTSSLRVFDLSLGEMLWSRRTVFMALIVGLPILLAVLVRVLVALDLVNLVNVRVGGEPVEVAGATLFGFMIWLFFLRFSVPVLGVFYGTALIADEVEDRTITYLFTRPIRRGAVLMGKYLAYLACTGLVVCPRSWWCTSCWCRSEAAVWVLPSRPWSRTWGCWASGSPFTARCSPWWEPGSSALY